MTIDIYLVIGWFIGFAIAEIIIALFIMWLTLSNNITMHFIMSVFFIGMCIFLWFMGAPLFSVIITSISLSVIVYIFVDDYISKRRGH